MDSERGPKGGRTLASKLEHLFETVIPPGRGPYGTEEVAQAITASGASISGSYVWLLRKGQRDNPTMRHLQGIADFFGVPAAYFFDEQVAADVDADLGLLVALRDAGVQNVALRAAGLSSKSLHSISEVIERVRELEGLLKDAPDHRSAERGHQDGSCHRHLAAQCPTRGTERVRQPERLTPAVQGSCPQPGDTVPVRRTYSVPKHGATKGPS